MSRFVALRPGALAMLLVGAIVLFVADSEALRVGSAALLLAGIGLGVFAIATPHFLGGDEHDDVAYTITPFPNGGEIVAEQWSWKGKHVGSCICDSPCPCIFGQDPDKGYCGALIVESFDQGSYGSIDLSGRTVALALSWEGNVFSGDLTVGIYVDEDATDEQLEAIETIVTGKAGGAWENLAGLFGTVKGVKRAPVESSDGDNPRFKVGESEVAVEQFVGADEQNPLVVTNSPFDFGGTGLKIGKTQAKFVDPDWGFDFDLTYGDSGTVDLSS